MEKELSKEKMKDEELKNMKNSKKIQPKKVLDDSKDEQKGKNEKKVKENGNNRLADVIEKMEEETKKNQINKEKNKDESLELSEKTKNEMAIQTHELEKIEKEIRNETIIPKEKKDALYKKIFENIIIAIIIVVYFISINLCYKLIKKDIFEVIIKVSNMIFIICAVCIFEYAYKKESVKYTIKGIEMLVLAISALITMQIYWSYNDIFIKAITIMALLFSIYYVVKSIIEYVKYRKEIKNEANSIYRTARRNEVK